MKRCEAEAPFDDQLAFCRLANGHHTRWHSGLVDSRCPECQRRECHTDTCSMPDVPETVERVRWEGPARPMPTLSGLDALTARQWLRVIAEARPVNNSYGQPWVMEVDKGDVVATSLIYGPSTVLTDFLADAEEWGRELKRVPLTTAGLPD